LNPIVKGIEAAETSSHSRDRPLFETEKAFEQRDLTVLATEKGSAMSILSTISRLAHEYSEARARYLTERSIGSLPVELQKDIGWPDAYESRRSHSFPAGTWMAGK
jgi:hypothetical protein